MRTSTRSITLLAAIFTVLLLGPTVRLQAEEAAAPSLYERLGGVYSIATVVDDFIDRLLVNDTLNANPAIDAARKRVPRAGLKFQVTALVCQVTGGHTRAVTFTLILVALGFSMSRFDHPDLPVSLVGSASAGLAELFMVPMRLLWDATSPKDESSLLEWGAIAANSGLWGFGFALLLNCLSFRWSKERISHHPLANF